MKKWSTLPLIAIALAALSSAVYADNATRPKTYQIPFEKNSSQTTTQGLETLNDLSQKSKLSESSILIPFKHPSSKFKNILRANRALIVYRRLVEMGVNPEQIIFTNPEKEKGFGQNVIKVSFTQVKMPPTEAIANSQGDAKNIHETAEGVEIFYSKGSISPDGNLQLLIDCVEKIKEEGAKSIVISAYASADGTSHTNRILSLARALVIYEFITRRGINSEDILVEYYGATRFKDGLPFTSPENRRVVIKWSKDQSSSSDAIDETETEPSDPVVKSGEPFSFAWPKFSIPSMSTSLSVGFESAPTSLISYTTGAIAYGIGWNFNLQPWNLDIETNYAYRSFNRSNNGLFSINISVHSLALGLNQTFDEISDDWDLMLHYGARCGWWNSQVKYHPSELTRKGSGTDNGIYSALGMRFYPFDDNDIFTEPKLELSYHIAGMSGISLAILFDIGIPIR